MQRGQTNYVYKYNNDVNKTLCVYKQATYKHINLLKHKYCYPLSQTLDITYDTFI